jgi:hypothetical protein
MNKVNKCSICKIQSPFFIWTSSRYVSAGIRAMYPNDKVCLSCYEKQCKIHKPTRPETPSKTCKRGICPECGKNEWSIGRRNIIGLTQITSNGVGATYCMSENGESRVGEEVYCYNCGYVRDEE